MKKIVYGICGIGNGHLYRQLPIIDFLLKENHQVMIFTYGTAYDFFTNKYIHQLSPNKVELIKLALVDVPYFIGNKEGLDFSKALEINSHMDIKNNLQSFAHAQQFIGIPDLVITDYEPYSAQYGYAYDCPVVTIDQQSKYLLKNLPLELNGFNYLDEIMRLKMFFPLAKKRFACSFFKTPDKNLGNDHVQVIPTNIRPQILSIQNKPSHKSHYIVYLTAQSGFKQNLFEIVEILKERKEEFTIFIDKDTYQKNKVDISYFVSSNIHFAIHGENHFEDTLETCHGVISTAGHTLLSEAMHLGIPVYAMPLDLYEQQLSADIIGKNQFGVNHPIIIKEKLDDFIKNNQKYRKNIKNDTKILNKSDGLNILIDYVKKIIKA